jgi:hypothetical protein
VHHHYEALAEYWRARPVEAASTRLATYPPNQMAYLSPLLGAAQPATLVDLDGERPWDPAATVAQLEEAANAQQPLAVVFREETRLDPRRSVETWLNTQLFRMEERWFGPLRLVAYAPAAGAGETVPAGVRFGESIMLESVEVVDVAVRPGGFARFRLRWRATGAVALPYQVFLHVFAGPDLAAQHDGQPAGELRPTSTWQPGEPIVDQFAVRLPADAQPGVYQLRVGVYDLATQVRLPAELADGTPIEFFTGGALTVE